jgi:hypothetical protein
MISKQTFESSFVKMAKVIPLKEAYKAGVQWGGPIGGGISSLINIGARKPALTVAGITGAAITVMAANKLRGLFTMANETNKRFIMNRQTDIMRNIAYNTGQSQVPAQAQQPISYPMR